MRNMYTNLIPAAIVLFLLCCVRLPEATAGGCKCIDTVFYGYPGYYLHYAKCYPDSSICNEFSSVIHQATTILSPTNCNDLNCGIPCGAYNPPPRVYHMVSYDSHTKLLDESGLAEPVDPSCDIEQGICAPEYRIRDDFIGTIELPEGKTLAARILLLDIMYEKQGRRHRATFGFGLEVKGLPPGQHDELAGISLKPHEGVADLYEGFLPNKIRCFILTARR